MSIIGYYVFTYNIVITGYKEIYEAVKNRFERIGNHTAKDRLEVKGRRQEGDAENYYKVYM